MRASRKQEYDTINFSPSSHDTNLSKTMNYNRNVLLKYLKIKRQRRWPEALSKHWGPLQTRRPLKEQRGTVQRRRRTHMACVYCAALLSLDNKASVHYHIYRLVLKRLLLRQTQAAAVKRRDHRKSNQLSGKWNGTRLTVCYRKDTTRYGRRESGGRWSNISWPVKSEIYCDLNSWPASVRASCREISFFPCLHNLRQDRWWTRLNAESKTFIILILF